MLHAPAQGMEAREPVFAPFQNNLMHGFVNLAHYWTRIAS